MCDRVIFSCPEYDQVLDISFSSFRAIDILYADTNNTIFGGDGDNLLIGGKGSTRFWITNSDANLPTDANIITDFER